ncbi:MAG TPA: hypothetical protein VF762_10205 [Blastocatellia bacterium]
MTAKRKRVGDWEADTIIGNNHKQAMVSKDSDGDEEDFLRILVEEAPSIQLLGPGNIFGL